MVPVTLNVNTNFNTNVNTKPARVGHFFSPLPASGTTNRCGAWPRSPISLTYHLEQQAGATLWDPNFGIFNCSITSSSSHDQVE